MQMQILAYNADLYVNASQASLGTHGLCVIAVLAQVPLITLCDTTTTTTTTNNNNNNKTSATA